MLGVISLVLFDVLSVISPTFSQSLSSRSEIILNIKWNQAEYWNFKGRGNLISTLLRSTNQISKCASFKFSIRETINPTSTDIFSACFQPEGFSSSSLTWGHLLLVYICLLYIIKKDSTTFGYFVKATTNKSTMLPIHPTPILFIAPPTACQKGVPADACSLA